MMTDCDLAPDPWQSEVLLSDCNRMLFVCSRQVGKSTVAAFMCLHQALCVPDSTCLIFSPSMRQSGEIFRKKVLLYYNQLGKPIEATAETQTMLELENGSRIVSLPGEAATVRGFSAASLIVVDEAAATSNDLWIALNPMLAVSQGKLVCISSPMGQQGWFFDLWKDEGPLWHRTRVDAYQCPRINPDWLEEQRTMMPEDAFSQEYLCSFNAPLGCVFSTEALNDMFNDDSIKPLYPNSEWVK